MIERKVRIFPANEVPRHNGTIVVFMEDGSANLADKEIFKVCPAGITHWFYMPRIETPFERVSRLGLENEQK